MNPARPSAYFGGVVLFCLSEKVVSHCGYCTYLLHHGVSGSGPVISIPGCYRDWMQPREFGWGQMIFKAITGSSIQFVKTSIITMGCLKLRENGNHRTPIFTGCVYFHDTSSAWLASSVAIYLGATQLYTTTHGPTMMKWLRLPGI